MLLKEANEEERQACTQNKIITTTIWVEKVVQLCHIYINCYVHEIFFLLWLREREKN